MPQESPTARPPWLLVIDLLLVVVFAIVGRAAHAEALDVAGVVSTAWPFLVGAVLGQATTLAWRSPTRLWPTGVVVWLSTLVVGMLLRVVTGGGAALAFVIVATCTLALLLLGWRAVALVVLRVRRG